MNKQNEFIEIIRNACCPVYSWTAYVNVNTYQEISKKLNIAEDYLKELIIPRLRKGASGDNMLDLDCIKEIIAILSRTKI
jgi:hypothetical protein